MDNPLLDESLSSLWSQASKNPIEQDSIHQVDNNTDWDGFEYEYGDHPETHFPSDELQDNPGWLAHGTGELAEEWSSEYLLSLPEYLEKHNVMRLLEHLLSLCVMNEPEDPVQFLTDVTERLRTVQKTPKGEMAKDGKEVAADQEVKHTNDEQQQPLFAMKKQHCEGLFSMLALENLVHITHMQYLNAMDIMRLKTFNKEPEGWKTDSISKDTFLQETMQAWEGLLQSFR